MSTSSNAQSTGRLLVDRGLKFDRSCTNDLFDFDCEWKKFAKHCGCEAADNISTHFKNALAKILTEEYKSESDFDKKLFKWLTNTTKHLDKTARELKNKIIFSKEDSSGRRVGFSRRVEKSGSLLLTKPFKGSAENPASVFDHACVIFDRSNMTTYVTAIVELKMVPSSCSDFGSSKKIVGVLDEPDLSSSSSHGALGQALKYNFSVWQCMVTHGIHTEKIPVLVLAGQKQTDTKTTNEKLFFVLASLVIPKKLGDVFKYKIESFEKDCSADKNIEQGMAAYLYVLNQGLSVASKILETDNITPIPTSGKDLYFGGTEIQNKEFVASPIHKQQYSGISQGELFRAPLSDNLIASLSMPAVDTCLPQDLEKTLNRYKDETSDAQLLIKVSSCTLYHPLIHPTNAFAAIKEVCKELDGTAAPYIFDVLLGAYQVSDFGLVILMKDLKHSYDDLQPVKYCTKCELWQQYTALVEKALLPMADKAVCHADIRFGWDKTSNIMVKKSPPREMRLIDFDSLTNSFKTTKQKNAFNYDSDKLSEYQDGQYSHHRVVWWQCLLAAYCWLSETNLVDFDASSFMIVMSSDISEGNDIMIRLKELPDLKPYLRRQSISSNDVKSTLSILGEFIFLLERSNCNTDSSM
jgi:hypothetical protein